MANRFAGMQPAVTGPALGAYAITPSDSANLAETIRAVTVGMQGALSFVGTDGKTYTTGTLPAGTYPLFATRILATGTTATNLTGWV